MTFKIKHHQIVLLLILVISTYGNLQTGGSIVAETEEKTLSSLNCSDNGTRDTTPVEGRLGSVKYVKNATSNSNQQFPLELLITQDYYNDLINSHEDTVLLEVDSNGSANVIVALLTSYNYCQRVLSYKCLDDIIVNDMNKGQRLRENDQLNCTMVYGNVIINGNSENGTVPDPEVSTFLNNLTRIGGRLVINEINSQTSINFKNLKEVGKYKNGDELLPNIEIKSNVVEQITFPRIQSNECVPPGSYNPKINSEKTCIRIQNNQDPSENPLNITFENGKISNEETRDFTNDLLKMRILPPSEKIKIENEDSLEKRTEKYREFDWHSDAYDGIIELNAVFSIFIMAGMIAAPVAVFYLHKKLFDVAYVSVDMGDEKSNKDLFDDDEYFNVDDKRDSGMDDLGSI